MDVYFEPDSYETKLREDKNKISQVIFNLLTNAIKFSNLNKIIKATIANFEIKISRSVNYCYTVINCGVDISAEIYDPMLK